MRTSIVPKILALLLGLEAAFLATGCSQSKPQFTAPPQDTITLVEFDELLSSYCPGLQGKNLLQFQKYAREAENRYEVNHRLILAVVTVESRCTRNARSRVGAGGAMQLMPRTARWLGVRNVYSIKENVNGGTKYLAHLLEEFNYDLELALAAYNAGPTSVRRFGGIPPYPETQNFVLRVMETYYDYLAAA